MRSNAVMINSAFWDIGRLVTGSLRHHGGIEVCKNASFHKNFTDSWKKNASDLIDIITSYIPGVAWRGWRTANYIINPIPPCRNDLVSLINNASLGVAKSHGLSWIDFSSYPNVNVKMRDSHHPGANATAVFMRDIIQRIRSEIYAS